MDKEKQRKKLLEEAKGLAKKIAEEYKPEKIILFGSAATGDIRENSDVDLLVVKDTSDRPIERDQQVLRLLNPIRTQIPVDVLVLTPEEINWRLEAEDPFVFDMLEESTVLYENSKS